MTGEPFASVSSRSRVALIDLVETGTPEAGHAFVTQATRMAGEVGGRVAVVNDAVVPMILPDERDAEAERGIRALVVTDYPTRKAGEAALARRRDGGDEGASGGVRTFAARPVARVESWVGRTLPYTLGLLGRPPVPKTEEGPEVETLIERALVLGEQPDKARWTELAGRMGDRPFWMLNFLEFKKTAVYADDAKSAAPAQPISGAQAYRRYGQGMIRCLAAVGGRVGWSGRVLGQCAGRDDGRWHQIAIAVYPSPAAMMTMLSMPKYRAAHVHRAAALSRTRLLATQPHGRLE